MSSAATATERLDELVRRLRRECPWDREQDERSIVPHTVEEAYELADAALAGDDAKLLDELGDVLFQVHFLALLLEERGAGSLAQVADHCHAKLVRRHPHVFGDAEAASAADVVRTWQSVKRSEGTPSGDRSYLPALIEARKLGRDSAALGATGAPELHGAVDTLVAAAERESAAAATGDLLLATVRAATAHGVDAELALRAATQRARRALEEAGPA